jgi:hypothetical protein
VSLVPGPATDATKRIVIPLGATQEPPDSFSMTLAQAASGNPGHADVAPGPDPSMYAFTKPHTQRNLYRIPLH